MDVARDNAKIGREDLTNVFKYEEKETTVLRIVPGEQTARTWQLKTPEQWHEWMEHDCPRLERSAPGLVLILARRTGERTYGAPSNLLLPDLIRHLENRKQGRGDLSRAMTFATMSEKLPVADHGHVATAGVSYGGQREVRTVPFSEKTFLYITERFHVHGSIARVISRADSPVFSYDNVRMVSMGNATSEQGEVLLPAQVMNCRTANAWERDLALSATHFPHLSLTFAIAYGCDIHVELEILRRVWTASVETAYPLLLPGIFAEIERLRHLHVVETTVNELERRILELEFKPSDLEAGLNDIETETRNLDKRNAWLDTAYLRNHLITWKNQLIKMRQVVDEVKRSFSTRGDAKKTKRKKVAKETFAENAKFKAANGNTTSKIEEINYGRCDQDLCDDKSLLKREASPVDVLTSHYDSNNESKEEQTANYQEQGRGSVEKLTQWPSEPDKPTNYVPSRLLDNKLDDQHHEVEYYCSSEHLVGIGDGIKNRLVVIIDEYGDKIRECKMRVDGMAMATQWADGETNVQIALEMKRDSRHMRSIALVTMVFLPGTFFASVFSMTFFSWSGTDGAEVSGYIWIYLVLAGFSTLITLAFWWFFVVYRQAKVRNLNLKLDDRRS